MNRKTSKNSKIGLEAETRPRLENVGPPSRKQIADVPPPIPLPLPSEEARAPPKGRFPIELQVPADYVDQTDGAIPPFVSVYKLTRDMVDDRKTDDAMMQIDAAARKVNAANIKRLIEIREKVTKQYGPETAKSVIAKLKETLRENSEKNFKWFQEMAEGDITDLRFRDLTRNAAMDSAAKIVDELPGIEKLKKKAMKLTENSPKIRELVFRLFFSKVIDDLKENSFEALLPTKMAVLHEIYVFDFDNNPPEQLATKFSDLIQEHIDLLTDKLDQTLLKYPGSRSTVEFVKFVVSRLASKGANSQHEWNGEIPKYLERSGLLDVWIKELLAAKPELKKVFGVRINSKIGADPARSMMEYLLIGLAGLLIFVFSFLEVLKRDIVYETASPSGYAANVTEVKRNLDVVIERLPTHNITSQMKMAEEKRNTTQSDIVLKLLGSEETLQGSLKEGLWVDYSTQTIEQASDFAAVKVTINETVREMLATSNITLETSTYMSKTTDFMRAVHSFGEEPVPQTFLNYVQILADQPWIVPYRDFIGEAKDNLFLRKVFFVVIFEDILEIVNTNASWDVFNTDAICELTWRIAEVIIKTKRGDSNTQEICDYIHDSFKRLGTSKNLTGRDYSFDPIPRELNTILEKATTLEDFLQLPKEVLNMNVTNLDLNVTAGQSNTPVVSSASSGMVDSLSKTFYAVTGAASTAYEYVDEFMRYQNEVAELLKSPEFENTGWSPRWEASKIVTERWKKEAEERERKSEAAKQKFETRRSELKQAAETYYASHSESETEMRQSLTLALQHIFKATREIKKSEQPVYTGSTTYENSRRKFIISLLEATGERDANTLAQNIEALEKSDYYKMPLPKLFKLINRASVLTKDLNEISRTNDIHGKYLDPMMLTNVQTILSNSTMMETYQQRVLSGEPSWIRSVMGLDKIDLRAPRTYLQSFLSYIAVSPRKNEFDEFSGYYKVEKDEQGNDKVVHKNWKDRAWDLLNWPLDVGREGLVSLQNWYHGEKGTSGSPEHFWAGIATSLIGNWRMRYYVSFYIDIMSTSVCMEVVQGLLGIVQTMRNATLPSSPSGWIYYPLGLLVDASLFAAELGVMWLWLLNFGASIDAHTGLAVNLFEDWQTSVIRQVAISWGTSSVVFLLALRGIDARGATRSLFGVGRGTKSEASSQSDTPEEEKTTEKEKTLVEWEKDFRRLHRDDQEKQKNKLLQKYQDAIEQIKKLDPLSTDASTWRGKKTLFKLRHDRAKEILGKKSTFFDTVHDAFANFVAWQTNIGEYARLLARSTRYGALVSGSVFLWDYLFQYVFAPNVGAHQIFAFFIFFYLDLIIAQNKRVMKPNERWTAIDYLTNSIPSMTPASMLISFSKRLEAVTEDPATDNVGLIDRLRYVISGRHFLSESQALDTGLARRRFKLLLYRIFGAGFSLAILGAVNFHTASDMLQIRRQDIAVRTFLANEQVHEILKTLASTLD